jgi:Ca-activated chloride channel family protein
MFARRSLALAAGLVIGIGPIPPQPLAVETAAGIIEGTVRADGGSALPGAQVTVEGTALITVTGRDGRYRLTDVPAGPAVLVIRRSGFLAARRTVQVREGQVTTADVVLRTLEHREGEVADRAAQRAAKSVSELRASAAGPVPYARDVNTEEYKYFADNGWRSPRRQPLSTFSIDVDAASYGNIRRFLTQGQLPPKDAVRVEEMINYFRYDYADPTGGHPFSVATEVADAPWKGGHKLALIGLQGRRLSLDQLPPNNLVFLLDVSGSMNMPAKLPLVKAAFRLLVNQLRPVDRVAIVVYAGAAGLVLPSTPGSERDRILEAIDRLEAGGSTAGGAGIHLAYQVAREHFLGDGNNRVILATDGDFNVGVSSEGELVRLIEERRGDGVFLTVLGFGTGNLKDAKMEQLANKGNGHYAYVDDLLEAKKVFVQELGATLYTLAKDVKVQVEFNPARVKAYRLVGYENRILNDEDFNDDRKDAGEMGAGHSVTALYEIVPVGVESDVTAGSVDPLKYQRRDEVATGNGDWLTLKLRYKPPAAETSRLLERVVRQETSTPSRDFRFAAAVAEFGMLLRESEYRGAASYPSVLARARAAKGSDEDGYRAEFIRLVETAALLARKGVEPLEH